MKQEIAQSGVAKFVPAPGLLRVQVGMRNNLRCFEKRNRLHVRGVRENGHDTHRQLPVTEIPDQPSLVTRQPPGMAGDVDHAFGPDVGRYIQERDGSGGMHSYRRPRRRAPLLSIGNF